MNLKNIITAICSILLLSVGADKFLSFLEPPCSLEHTISPIVWQIFGVLQIAGGILIWLPNMKRFIVGFFLLFMSTFSIYHLTQGTYDIGGSSFIAVLFALLLWNPSIINKTMISRKT